MIEEQPVDVLESRWVVDTPTYQVHFWRQRSNPRPPAKPLWSSELHRLVGVRSVHEALEWAESHAGSRTVAVYAEVDRGEDLGLVLIYGTDPTRARD